MERVLQAVIVAIGIPAATAGFIVLGERCLALLPGRSSNALRPWLWLTPGLAFLLTFLLYPSVDTLVLSFRDARSTMWVGLQNYRVIFTDAAFLTALRNNAIWVVAFPAATVLLGIAIAILVDRVRYENTAKALIFLPMAISFVGAGVIWRFMYDYRPPPLPQTGTLNAFLTWAIPGFQPQAWLVNNPPLNNLALIAAAVWLWTGFCMVVISASLKGIPVELFEAARVDGASEVQVLRHVVLPSLSSTVAVVLTTMIIFALKAFDIVYVMTNGNFDTEVIANRMYKELFNVRDFGRASAIAIVLLAAIVPVMLLNIRRFRQQEETR